MKENLEKILRTIEEARRQVTDARKNHNGFEEETKILEEAELGLDWVKKKLEKLKAEE